MYFDLTCFQPPFKRCGNKVFKLKLIDIPMHTYTSLARAPHTKFNIFNISFDFTNIYVYKIYQIISTKLTLIQIFSHVICIITVCNNLKSCVWICDNRFMSGIFYLFHSLRISAVCNKFIFHRFLHTHKVWWSECRMMLSYVVSVEFR